MNPLLIYMVKSALCISVFYIVYATMLSRDTMYGRNRVFILVSVISAIILPFITIETSKSVGTLFFGKMLSEVLITGSSSASETGMSFAIGWPHLILVIYITGVLLFITRLIFNLGRLYLLIKKNREAETNIIRFRGLNTAGFSAVNYIFINSGLSGKDAEEVLRHENKHLEHFHSYDILFMEIIKSLQWFNPFIYLFDRSLRAVHEYQADEGCLKSGMPVLSYQQLLMNQIFKARAFTFTNSFSNPTLIKKRMIMMTKKRSRMLANLKILMVMPVIAVLLIAFSSCKDKQQSKEAAGEEIVSPPPPPPPPPPSSKYEVANGDTTWVVVDEMPVFREGGIETLLKFLRDNTNYPEKAKEEDIQGRVVVNFVVKTDGSIDQVKILKGVDPELDAEALRVVKSLPAFEKPGIEKGRPVAVWFNVPITFALK